MGLQEGRPSTIGLSGQSLLGPVAGTAMANVLVTSVGSVGGLLIARSLGASLRGEFAAVMAWTTFVSSLLVFGLPQATCYWVSREPREASATVLTASMLAFGLGVAIAGVGFAVAPLIARSSVVLVGLRVLFGLMPLMMLSAVWGGALQGLRIQRWNLMRAAQPVAYLGLVAGLMWRDSLTIGSAIASLVISLVVQFVAAALFTRPLLSPGPGLSPVRPLMSYGVRTAAAGVPWLVNARLDQVILSVLVTSAALGNYAIAVSITLLAAPVATAFGAVALPRIAGTATGQEGRRIQRLAIVGSVLAAGAVLAPMAVAAPALLPWLFGDSFRAAVTPLRILAVGTVMYVVNYVMTDVLRGWGRPLQPALAQGVGAVVTVVLLAILVPTFGINGAAAASTAAYTVVAIILGYMLRAVGAQETLVSDRQ